ncbi:hypothetical protein ACXYMU_12845 [Pontibacter sp. CAU 1760]
MDNKEIEDRQEYKQLRREIEILQEQNRQWEKEFNCTTSARREALQLEKEGKLFEALAIYLNSIDKYENSNQLTIYNYAFDIDRVIVLYGKTKQQEKLKAFLEEKVSKHANYNKANAWVVRLSKIKSDDKVKTTPVNPIDIHPQTASNPTLGKQIDTLKKIMPEFNFYYNMSEGSSTLGYSSKIPYELSKKLSEFRQAFEIIKSKAKVAENEGDFKIAIETYEKMIIEECEDVEPYERLIIIYSKLNWRQEEISVLERAIIYFSRLKDKQLEYVNYLAQKYGMIDKAQEYISQNKKIYYYHGAFELYNPHMTRLNKWRKRLEKIKSKTPTLATSSN